MDDAVLPPLETAGRLDRLRATFEEAGCDALVVTKLENVRYLTGFSGSAGCVAVRGTGALLCTDGRYREQAGVQLEEAGVVADLAVGSGAEQLEALGKFLEGAARVGLEVTSSWAEQLRFAEALAPAELVPARRLVEGLRTVKDSGELARIERACEVADVALAQVKGRLAESVTESEFAAELEFEMRLRGASGPAFDSIVASGPNSAMPHHRPTDRRIEPGDLVVVDFGATVEGYRSDMTRTVCVGDPEPDLVELVEAVFASQRAGIRAVTAGASAADVDAACREVLVEAGYGPAFVHSTGHGVGLEIHEAPAVAPGSADILPAGAIVTVEPGAYLARRGGARIEDTVVVTANGARVLTKSTKDYTLEWRSPRTT